MVDDITIVVAFLNVGGVTKLTNETDTASGVVPAVVGKI